MKNIEVIKITKDQLDFIPAICLDPSVGKDGKEKMKEAMNKRVEWIKEMMTNGLEIFIALEPPRDEIISYKWAGKLKHSDLVINGKVPMGLLECMPIEYALEPIRGKNSLFINCMWILPPFWEKGVGKALVTKFIERAREVGSATVIGYDRTNWFETSIKYMPMAFFKKYGFIEVDRDEERVLLFLDFKKNQSPTFIPTNFNPEFETRKDKLSVFFNYQCPWSTYMVKEIQEGIKQFENLDLSIISTNNKKIVKEFGISRGIILNSIPVFKRMDTWNQVKKKINILKST
ncbi:MAG: GNAT family N-acetyltransferase [Candidatus Thorarchaeota archaeon]